ncbi:MAG: tRNA (cytidine(34)-2'-O)-methyltransferase [Xanthomonadaceae bacterium]|nr:tRNA (cytidine(34)-2'-O)-methyltransferase [Xanthomonadaceae bacterium]
MPHGLNIVLIEPEIPQNTGTIGRLCLGIGATLHLVEPMAFEITDTKLKRAGLDYWEHLTVVKHKSIDEFLSSLPENAELVFLETRGGRTLYEHTFKPGSYLIFGKETFGLPDWLLNKYASQTVRIPIYDARVRSFNLSNSVSVAAYEAIRQLES